MAAWGQYDFCPWANPYVYWLKQPIGWFALGALASAMVGLFVAPQGWLLCGVLVVVMVLGVAWPLVALRGLSAELAFHRSRCHEGETVRLTMTVTNRWPWPVWGLLVEQQFLTSAATGNDRQALVALDRVAAWSRSRFEFTWSPPRRGLYPRSAPVLVTGYPFGLWTARKPMSLPEPLLVWPRGLPLSSLPLWDGEQATVAGALIDRVGDEGDVLSARAYQPGDSLRRVHWVHTARRDTLIVRERQTAARRGVVVEFREAAFAADVTTDRCDWGLRVAASICRELHAHGCDLVFVLGSEQISVTGSRRGLHALFDRLAMCEPGESPEASGSSLRGIARGRAMSSSPRLPHGSPWIVVTTIEQFWGESQDKVDRIEGVKPTDRLAARRRTREAPRRMVVLAEGPVDGDARQSPAMALVRAARPWMTLDITGDVTRQVQQQWERQCHDDWTRQ